MNRGRLKRMTTPNERPLMVVYAGPNGARKSQLTKTLEHQLPSLKVIDADAIATTFTNRLKAQADIAEGRETVVRYAAVLSRRRASPLKLH